MSVWESKFVPAPILVDELDGAFGNAWVEWEPESLRSAVEDRWSVRPSDEAWAAVMASKVLRSNPAAYFTDLNGFEDVTLGLCCHQPNFAAVEVCSPGEILLGTRLARRVVRKWGEFSATVVAYVRGCFREAGVYAFPKELAYLEPDGDKKTRDRIRELAARWGSTDPVSHGSTASVQAAKLHDVYAHASGWAEKAREAVGAAG